MDYLSIEKSRELNDLGVWTGRKWKIGDIIYADWINQDDIGMITGVSRTDMEYYVTIYTNGYKTGGEFTNPTGIFLLPRIDDVIDAFKEDVMDAIFVHKDNTWECSVAIFNSECNCIFNIDAESESKVEAVAMCLTKFMRWRNNGK